MGLGLSGGYNSQSSKSTSTSQDNAAVASSTNKTYTADQTSLQGSLIQALQGLISGSASPTVTAAQTASADQINSEYSSVGDRTQKFLAARGFGSSGQAGKSVLQTELGRQGALANNSASYGATGLQLQQQGLQDSLSAAFNNSGTTSTGTSSDTKSGSSTGSESGWGVGASAKI